ncbi:YesK family protein [Ornithinibacillus scapharcae]|uniref:YesK family protein n=1 Tax=Ornithinibacillus scapharcae TaxID=1147159 RepID=UPI000225B25E|nr:YesK family protein [Ornithinibacillus scapharcae]
MHLFMVLYLLGLLIGIGFYTLTYLFSKEMKEKKRSIFLFTVGIVIILVGLVIGGFEGMPLSLLGLGVITISIITLIMANKALWRKYIFVFIVLIIIVVFAFSYLNRPDYWIIQKENEFASSENEIYKYVELLQTENISGFKIMDTEDSKAVILSLGEERTGTSIEVTDMEELNGKTVIYVKSFYNKSTESNPTIIIGVDRLEPVVEIRDVDGTMYKKIQE